MRHGTSVLFLMVSVVIALLLPPEIRAGEKIRPMNLADQQTRFLFATAYVGLATGSENPNPPELMFGGATYTDIINFIETKLGQPAGPEWLDTNGKVQDGTKGTILDCWRQPLWPSYSIS